MKRTRRLTRVEIAGHVRDAFARVPVRRDDLVAAATRADARPVVIKTLRHLPDREYRELRDLWVYLPGIPVEHDDVA